MILLKPDRSSGKIDLANAIIETYNGKHGLPRKRILNFLYDGTTYFLAERDSIFVFNEKLNRFIQDTSLFLKNYIVNDADGTGDAPTDHLGRVWANLGSGVFVKLPTKDNSLKIIDAPFRELKKDYPVWAINPSVNKDGKSVVWFASREGVIRYDGNLDETSNGSYNTIIRGINLNDDSVFYSGFATPAEKPEFSHSWNSVLFQYAAPFFKQENEIVYSTYLEGHDKNWSEWNKQNFRGFGNLTAGKYTFRVKAKNIYDTESKEAVFSFSVLPPWYATWWAYMLYLIIATAVIYSIVRWRTHQLHAKQRELEKTVAERTVQLSHRVEELAVINSVQDGLVREMNMEGIYELVGEKIRQIFNAQVIDIVTYDSNTHLLQDHYAYEKGDRTLVGKWEPFGFRKHVIDTGQILLVNENLAQKSIEFDSKAIHAEQSKSAVFVPLITSNEVKGMISLQDLDKEHAFSDSDVSLLTTLANSMSVALESARRFDETNRLLKETEQRSAELAVINSVQEGLAHELDMQAIYDLVGDRIREVFNAQSVMIATLDKEVGVEYFQYNYGKDGRYYPQPRPYDKLRVHLIKTQQKILVNNNIEEAVAKFGLNVIPGTELPKSILFVPLTSGGKVNSYVSLQNMDLENAFSDSDVRLLETLSNSMSIALENARLFDETNRLLKETEQRTAELAVINSVQEGLAHELDMQGIYNLVGDRVQKLFQTHAVIIATFDLEKGIEHFNYVFENGQKYQFDSRPINTLRRILIERKQTIYIDNEEKARDEYGFYW